MAGASECRIGIPITPARLVMAAPPPSASAAAEPGVAAAGLGLEELAVALGEEVVAGLVLQDVEDPRPVGWVEGGLDRRPAGRRDRRGRQALHLPGVVRRVAREVDLVPIAAD